MKITNEDNMQLMARYEDNYFDLAIIDPRDHVIAELFYDFKSKPKNVELVCTGKMGGARAYYALGF